MDISKTVININKTKNYNGKDFESILNYVYLMFYNYPLTNHLIAKDDIGDFIITEYGRFNKIIKSYTTNKLDFESYLCHIIRQEVKYYNIKIQKKNNKENYKIEYYDLNKVDTNDIDDNNYCPSKIKLAFSSKDKYFKDKKYNLKNPDNLKINPQYALILAIICSPQLNSYEINRLNNYFLEHNITNFISLCSKANSYIAKKKDRKETIENRQIYNFNRLIEYENKINNCIETKEDPSLLIEKRKKCKEILEKNIKVKSKLINRITYREIADILNINSSTIASDIRKVKHNLENFNSNTI